MDPAALRLSPEFAPQAPDLVPKKTKPKTQPERQRELEDSVAKVQPDGTVRFEKKAPAILDKKGRDLDFHARRQQMAARARLPVRNEVIVPLDVSAILKYFGPNDYEQRTAFLNQTREERAKLSSAACKERERIALYALRGRLASMWKDPTLNPEEKRAILFDVWDECTNTDAKVRRFVRATVMGFIAEHLPLHSALAYTSVELAALNRRRRSSQRFTPYPADATTSTTTP